VTKRVDQFKHREPGLVGDDDLAIDQTRPHPGSAAIAATIRGKRLAKSLPLRV
jgi:hypothetical protein